MTETPISQESATEAWLREAFDHFLGDIVLFSRTFIAFCFHPGRSAREWHAGERVFMNPLGFAAIAAGVYWSVASVLTAAWPISRPDGSDTLAGQLTSAVGPYVHYGLLGIAMHFGLRWLGSERRILGSIGIAFFAGGSIGTLTALVVTTIARWFGHERGTSELQLRAGDLIPLILLIAAVASYALMVAAMARALMKLHHAPGWKALIAGVFAVVTTALLFGTVLTNGDYGWRPYIGLDLQGGLPFSFGFRG